VFVGFGLVPDLRSFHPFHPIANSTLFTSEHMSGGGDEPDSNVVGVLDFGEFRGDGHSEGEFDSEVQRRKVEMGCGDTLNASAGRDKGILQCVLAH
jgi:hypothetical protein